MAQNSTITGLDASQVTQRVFDVANDAFRVSLGDSTGLAVVLTAAGDSVVAYNRSVTNSSNLTNASTGTVLAAFDCSGMSQFQLYTHTTATLSGEQVCTLQVSPHDTADVWIDTALTVTPSGTNATVVVGTALTNVVARRARVKIATSITSGTFTLYCVAQGT